MNDIILRQDIVDELDFDPRFISSDIGVAVANGVVTLTGHVHNYAEKVAVEKAVQGVKGVRALAEEIEVRYSDDSKTSDDQIAERALAILDWDTQIPKKAVLVKVQKGWVTLTGAVQWQYQRGAAETAIRRLSGVVGVSNLVEVNPQVQPRDMKGKIIEALRRNAEIKGNSIRVSVHDDKVTLEGKVKGWHERGVAEQAAWSATGVRVVDDKLALD